MEGDDLKDLLSAARELLEPHLQRSEPLRRLIGHVGRWLIAEAERAGRPGAADTDEPLPQAHHAHAATQPPPPQAGGGAPDGSEAQPAGAPAQAAEVPLRLGDATVHVPVRGTAEGIARAQAAASAGQPSSPQQWIEERFAEGRIDLSMVERRCRLKAESCRVYIERRAAEGDPLAEPPLVERVNQMIAEAKSLPSSFLWVFWRERTQPDDAVLEVIAHSYDAAAEAAGLLRQVEGLADRARDDDVRAALELAAEASSALRIALERTWLSQPDTDQEELHRWVRRAVSQRQVYVARFMRLDDPADPNAVEDLLTRLRGLRAEVQRHADRMKQIDENLKRIRYHVDLLAAQRDLVAHDHHFRRIAEAIGMLAELGVPCTDGRLRRAVGSRAAESFPSEHSASPEVQRVLEHVRAWYDAVDRAGSELDEQDEGDRWSERVREARSLLAGSAIVIIGGEPRKDAIDRIRGAFDLDDVNWVRLTEHGTGHPMRAPIDRPETRMVLVLVKLAGHLHAEEAISRAKQAGKPLVMVTAGYSPEQIAEAVLEQASGQLRSMQAASQVP